MMLHVYNYAAFSVTMDPCKDSTIAFCRIPGEPNEYH